MEIINKYQNKPWDWDIISGNPNITMEIIENNPDKPWNWGFYGISDNPNITMDFIEKHIDKNLDWEKIARCSFKKDYENELQKLKNFNNIEEELIQKTWHPRRFQKWCLDENEKEDEEE